MLNRFSAALLLTPLLLIPVSAKAESPVPAASPFGAQVEHYERFMEARNTAAAPENEQDDYAYTRQEKEKPVAIPLTARPQQNIELSAPQEKFSALETMYSGRAEQKLAQFGYDLFGIPSEETQNSLNRLGRVPDMPMGAVQDDFILHAGDELDITFTGQRTDHGVYKVNTQGLLVIPDMPPIPADGRAIGQVRLSIQAAARNLHNTDAYVSLSSVRQIGVLIVGHVKRPGRQTMTVFHTVIDALMTAGGVDKTGSLRMIKLVRGGTATQIDLYKLLAKGDAGTDLQLRDGDRIIVPPVGPTVAIAGEVKRPGIYEILPRDTKLSLTDMLDLGGGVLAPGRNRFLSLEITRAGHETVKEVHDAGQQAFGDGSLLMVLKGQEKRAGTVEIAGHARRPGLYAIDETPMLAELLSSSDILGPDAYPLIGVIERRNADELSKQFIAFPLRLVLKAEYDTKLEDGDKVHLFSDAEIRRISEDDNKNPDDDPALDSFLRDHSAVIRGEVRAPGAYPIAEGITLDGLIAAAGGPTLEADQDQIEISSASQEGHNTRHTVTMRESTNVSIRAGDSIRIGQKFKKDNKTVLIIGEVKSPGRYDLMEGDKVSDLIRRAGGLTGDAYPDGTVFSRESERKAEEARFRAQARQMQASIAAAVEQDHEKIGAGQIAEARALAMELQEAEGVGRITVETDPYVLAQNPEQDMLLEAGDRLYIPKRSLTVRVSGEVLSPATLQFRKSKEAEDYVEEAGGFTHDADKGRSFVLYPDGSAQPLDIGRFSSDDRFIPPGSTIVVPRDPKPFDFIQSAKDVSQILSNLAITALFIDDVRDDN